MIVEDTLITVSARRAERRVQDLRIADLVYNPLTRSCDEIADILSREIQPGSTEARTIWPKVIPAGSIAPMRPRRDLAVSPGQILMTLRPPATDSPVAGVVEVRADSLNAGEMKETRPIRYFAIFFDHPRYLDAGGVLARAFTLEDVTSDRFR